jgi:hypothetical protein
MKSNSLKPALIGASIGLADGLAFVTAAHTSFDWLASILVYPSLPCLFVAWNLGSHLPGSLEWVAWTAGVLTMTLIGAVLGLAVGWVLNRFRRPTSSSVSV